jgi:hypothetical protein
LLGEGNVFSHVGGPGFMIGGNTDSLKEGDINPLTGDKLKNGKSESTASEIEVWKITFME